MEIKVDDLSGPEIAALLQEHLDQMASQSPPESIHALDLAGLRKPEITFWTVWENGELLGCGAIKALNADHAELKSMRTAAAHQRKGVAKRLLQYILTEAKARGFSQLSLETGSQETFAPARNLYTAFGFTPCAPFADYWNDPNSFFMTKAL